MTRRETGWDRPGEDLLYSSGAGSGDQPVRVSVFADRPVLRAELHEDAELAGAQVMTVAGLDVLFMAEGRPLDEVVYVDVPRVDIETMAALARLDQRALRVATQLVVATTTAALDDVFGCMDQAQVQFLVDPTRGERAVAMGLALAQVSGKRVRELSDSDRLMLLRLSEQVGQIAGRIESLSPGRSAGAGLAPGPGLPLDPAEADRSAFDFGPGAGSSRTPRTAGAAPPPLPDPRLIRRMLRHRQARSRYFDADLFADPAWDMLLDLAAARAEHVRVSVTSLCIAAGVPPTTALRWIGQMVENGIFVRSSDEADRRRTFIELSDTAADAMARYFAEVGVASDAPV